MQAQPVTKSLKPRLACLKPHLYKDNIQFINMQPHEVKASFCIQTLPIICTLPRNYKVDWKALHYALWEKLDCIYKTEFHTNHFIVEVRLSSIAELDNLHYYYSRIQQAIREVGLVPENQNYLEAVN